MSDDGEGWVDHIINTKRKSPGLECYDGGIGESSQTGANKKQRLVWTWSLQDRFLQALQIIGLERAVPNNVLEVMNVPGLTRHHVASHLQKYKGFLEKVYENMKTADKQSSDNDKFPPTIFIPSDSSRPYPLPLRNQNRQHVPRPVLSLNQVTSSSCLIAQSGSGQARLLSNNGPYRALDNTYQSNTSIQGNLSNRINPNPNPPVLISENVRDSSNYVGLNIANIKRFLESKKSFNGPSDVSLPNASSMIHDHSQVACQSFTSPPSHQGHDSINGGHQLAGVMTEYEMLLNMDEPHAGNVENGAGVRIAHDVPSDLQLQNTSASRVSLPNCRTSTINDYQLAWQSFPSSPLPLHQGPDNIIGEHQRANSMREYEMLQNWDEPHAGNVENGADVQISHNAPSDLQLQNTSASHLSLSNAISTINDHNQVSWESIPSLPLHQGPDNIVGEHQLPDAVTEYEMFLNSDEPHAWNVENGADVQITLNAPSDLQLQNTSASHVSLSNASSTINDHNQLSWEPFPAPPVHQGLDNIIGEHQLADATTEYEMFLNLDEPQAGNVENGADVQDSYNEPSYSIDELINRFLDED